MATSTIRLPEGFVLDEPTPPEGFVLDEPNMPEGFVLDEPAISTEPDAEDLEKLRRMGVKRYRSPAGKLYQIAEPTIETPAPVYRGTARDIRPGPVTSLEPIKAAKQIIPGFARGVEQMVGTAGSMAQWAAEQARIGDIATKHINIPGVNIAAEYIIRKFGPKKPTAFYDKQMKKYAGMGEKWADWWEEQANKGWEAPDPEVMQAKWREKPLVKGAAVISEAAPNYLVAIAASVLTKNPQVGLMFISGLSGAGAYRRQRKAGTGKQMANAVAALTAGWEYITEKIPFEYMMKGGVSPLKKLITLPSMEAAQEFIQGVGENFLEYFGYTAKDLKSVPAAVREGLAHTLDNWIENVVAGFGLGIIGAGVSPAFARKPPTAAQPAPTMPTKPPVRPVETIAEARPTGVVKEAEVEKVKWMQQLSDMIDDSAFREGVAESIQKDGQKVIDAAAKGDIATLERFMTKYARDKMRDQGGVGAGPGKVKQARRGAVSVWQGARFALEKLKAQEALAKPAPAEKPAKGMRPGFVDLRPALEVHKTFMRVLEPSKAVERKLGKEAYAALIKSVHATDVARVKFEQTELPERDKVFNEFQGWLNKFSQKDLDNLMLSRGEPVSVEAKLIKRDAINKLPKELRSPQLTKTIQHIADFNYKYLQSVVGDDINRVADYFYGIYKDSKKVDKFLDYWRTTKRFTKEKKLPTYADAKSYGLEIRDPNPVQNLKAEYVAISHLEGMNWLKDELMRTGKGKFIDDFPDAPIEWEKVQDPTFSGLRLQPDLTKLINNLIATNKITKIPTLNTLRQVNNFLRTIKFIGSAFHLLSVAKQSVADTGYLGFYKIAKFYRRPGEKIPFGVKKGTAIQGITAGFRKNDPIFKTPQYRDYIRHGGTHRYSVEAESRKTFVKAIASLNKEMGKAVKYAALPLKIPVTFVNWMFNSYIPKVKYAKYLDFVAGKEEKLGRLLTSSEKVDIIKEQQNFYGMMNERLFGRSGTVTTALRFYFMSPGYAEGNYRTMIKAAIQWGGKGGYNATRSRSNIVNSLIITATLATVGTLIMTGKWPKKPETPEDLRDLFKIDTGKTDEKDRRIMIDLMTYDKDYWNVGFNVLKGRPDEAVRVSIKRIGGMKAPTADMITDLAMISMGKAIYNWKGDKVMEITDPFLRKAMKLTVHEIKKLEPISVSVFKQSRRREIDTTIAAIESLLGVRPTKTEKDKREQAITNRIYSLKGQQEKLYQYLGTLKNPRQAISRYNKTVNNILDSRMVPEEMRKEWRPKLLVDVERLLTNKVYYLTQVNRTPEEIERARKYLENFGVTPKQAQEYLTKYWQREKRKPTISPLERHPVIGRGRKRRRLAERYD